MSSSEPLVEGVSVTNVMVPINPPHRTASGLVSHSPLVLIDLICSRGLIGRAILFTYTPAALKPVSELVLSLQALLVGQPLDPSALYAMLHQKHRLIGTQGLVGMALAGIDMAAWDALAHHRSTSLSGLLNSQSTQADVVVRAYGGTGYDGELETARQAESWARAGYQGVKAKIGYPTVDEDLRVVRAMRNAVGPDVSLMVDYNQSLSESEARSRLAALDDAGLEWVEEPVLAHDFTASAAVAAAAATPIQGGENWWGPLDVSHAIAAGSTDLVMLDVMKIGGVTGWLASTELLRAADIPTSSHLWPEVSAQLLCVESDEAWLEYVDWWAPILEEPLVVDQGIVRASDVKTGSGVNWNPDGVERYRV